MILIEKVKIGIMLFVSSYSLMMMMSWSKDLLHIDTPECVMSIVSRNPQKNSDKISTDNPHDTHQDQHM